MGTTLLRLNRPNEALAMFEEAIEYRADGENLIREYSLALARSGNTAAAHSQLRSAAAERGNDYIATIQRWLFENGKFPPIEDGVWSDQILKGLDACAVDPDCH